MRTLSISYAALLLIFYGLLSCEHVAPEPEHVLKKELAGTWAAGSPIRYKLYPQGGTLPHVFDFETGLIREYRFRGDTLLVTYDNPEKNRTFVYNVVTRKGKDYLTVPDGRHYVTQSEFEVVRLATGQMELEAHYRHPRLYTVGNEQYLTDSSTLTMYFSKL